MNVGRGRDSLMADINVTPFVDVMLVLLIIFMVTAPMMVQGVDVALPEVTAEPMESEKEPLLVTINAQNEVFINDYQVSLDFFSDKLAKILETRSDRAVYLRADKQVPYGVVVMVMAEIKAAGVDRLGMVTIPPEEEGKASAR
ncbi:MAG: protein TolR [Desulfobacterales bacterium]|jgi:biopolymer transport protein TolR|nr:protein TolR [Desulfobacteraceae bacterium]MDY0313328.1 protein TolR [Desulfobacterales bacterium]